MIESKRCQQSIVSKFLPAGKLAAHVFSTECGLVYTNGCKGTIHSPCLFSRDKMLTVLGLHRVLSIMLRESRVVNCCAASCHPSLSQILHTSSDLFQNRV